MPLRSRVLRGEMDISLSKQEKELDKVKVHERRPEKTVRTKTGKSDRKH